MTRRARWIVAVAALGMSAAYALPLWRIALIAPQYPEGLGMLIRINAIDGFKEGDLQSINGLNHYIGMKEIVPDSIPELRLMPVILGVMIALGLVVAALGRRGFFMAWAVTLGLVFAAGLADFWKWGYEYGHDLSPTAIIKVPDMTYQPPLIGSKQLLNFRATSWPASGGWVLIAAATAVAGVLVSTLRRRSRPVSSAAAVAFAVAGCVPAVAAGLGRPAVDTIVVDPAGAVSTITAALRQAKPGGVVIVRPGTYRERTIVIRTAGLTLQGTGWPVIDGEQAHAVLVIAAPDVTVRGFVITGTGVSDLEDRAGIRAREAARCTIEGNRVRDNLFGIYLERSASCVVRDNDVGATNPSQASSGNGIHLWQSPDVVVERNRVSGHRDGIYFEFSSGGRARDNVSERNQRYGLHFMYSDSCRYERNQFLANAAGVAVMYSRGITIAHNRFADARGGGAYGLLLKEILGGEIAGNIFSDNSTGLFLEGATRLAIRDNAFIQNGWAARVLAGATGNHFSGNQFSANAFDVTTNSRSANSTFEGNWWDAYRGYDLDRDGLGDVPFHPVRLFALIAEQHPASLVLLRSPSVAVLDAAERLIPLLTPDALVDRTPLMRRPALPQTPVPGRPQ